MLSQFFTPRLLAILGGVIVLLVAVLFGVRYYITVDLLASRPPVAASFWESTSIGIETSLAELGELVDTLPRQLSQLDGRVYPDSLSEQVVAVMIENHPASRAQMQGLPEASIVYEVLSEGGITRYLAIFGYPDLQKVGPVRSARPYFIDWAEEYGGAYVHAGGSKAALEQLESAAVFNFDEDGEILYRDFQYTVPHNLFLDLAALKESLTEQRWSDRVQGEWFDFSGELPSDTEPAKQLTIDFSLPSYRVDYTYDATAGDYQRLLGGSIHKDTLGTPVRPTNIIIQFTDYTILDEEGRLDFTTIGSGKAWYFSAGQRFTGRWTRLRSGRTQFFTDLGERLSLLPGQTFITVVGGIEKVSWK